MHCRRLHAVIAGVVFAVGLGTTQGAGAAGPNPNETVDTSMDAAALAQTLVGAGVAIENVVYTGAANARGTFSFVDATVVGMGQGVILSSGDAHDVVGPNTSPSFSTDWTNAGDADLDTLSGFPTHDAAVLEFDFTPTANQVAFQYAFSSDEYSEWVNTPYNDVFAFFINGQNCALVRQVAGDPAAPFVPVAVNNINDSNPIQNPPPPPMRPDLFRNNDVPAGGPPSPLDLEMDGLTRVITCQAAVLPGVVNHMKLAIADASDGIYDSAVFIEAGSLVSNENPTADLGLDPSKGAAPLDVTATIEGHDPNGLPLTYTLDWGDGTVITGQALPDLTATAMHTYQYGGTYVVTLTISNGTLTGTDHDDVDVLGPPPPTTTSTVPTTTSSTTTTDVVTTTSSTTTTSMTLPQICPPDPVPGCRLGLPRGSTLALKDHPVDAKDELKWKWGKGDATSAADFGDPVVGTAYRLCIYDAAAVSQPRMAVAVPADGTCGNGPCWKPTKKGFARTDKAGTPDGVTSVKLNAGLAGKAEVVVAGKGVNLPMPTLGLTLPVTVQLVREDGALPTLAHGAAPLETCWETTFASATKNDAAQFSAKGP